jgi:hypothetical protein
MREPKTNLRKAAFLLNPETKKPAILCVRRRFFSLDLAVKGLIFVRSFRNAAPAALTELIELTGDSQKVRGLIQDRARAAGELKRCVSRRRLCKEPFGHRKTTTLIRAAPREDHRSVRSGRYDAWRCPTLTLYQIVPCADAEERRHRHYRQSAQLL